MATLENKKVNIEFEKGVQATYADLSKACLNNTPQGGFSSEQVVRRIRMLEALDASEEIIEIHDEDVPAFKQAVRSMRWISLHKDVAMYISDVEKM